MTRLGQARRALLGSVILVAALWVSAAWAASGDLTFTTKGVGDVVQGVAAESGGTAIVTGRSGSSWLVRRVQADGSLGTTFAGGGGTARAAAVQSDGKIVVAGDDGNGALVVRRYLASGSLDQGFGGGGTTTVGGVRTITSIAVGPCGDVVVGGGVAAGDGFDRPALVRLLSSGGVDTDFGPGGVRTYTNGDGPTDGFRNSRINGVAIQPDGKVVFAGQQTPGLQITAGFIGRTNRDGTLDGSFAGGVYYYDAKGGVNSVINGVAIDASGRIIGVGADVRQDNSLAVFVRLQSNGSLDSTFGSGGVFTAPASSGATSAATGPRAVQLLANGRIVAAGASQTGGSRPATVLVVTPTGALDTTFGSGGRADASAGSGGGEASALSVAPDGSIYTAGTSQEFQGANTGFVAKFAGAGAPLAAGACAATTPPPTTTTTPPPTTTATPTTPTTPTTPVVVTPPAKPAVSSLRLSTYSLSTRRSATLAFSLNRKATVTVTLEQLRNGRRSGSKCSAPSARNRRGKACTYYSRLRGSKRVSGKAGANSVKLTTTFGTTKLKPGTYRLSARVTNGNTGKRTFKVVAAK